MLRGPQTPGELKQRTDRLHPFADLAAIHATLQRLIDRDLVLQLARRPGQKEERYAQRLGEDDETQPAPAYVAAPAAYTPAAPRPAARPADRRRVARRPQATARSSSASRRSRPRSHSCERRCAASQTPSDAVV